MPNVAVPDFPITFGAGGAFLTRMYWILGPKDDDNARLSGFVMSLYAVTLTRCDSTKDLEDIDILHTLSNVQACDETSRKYAAHQYQSSTYLRSGHNGPLKVKNVINWQRT